MLIGHVGRDPEMRHTPGGTAVTTFSLATGRSWVTPEGERREATEWFNVVAWRRLAEICHRYLHKGSRAYVEGYLQTRSWEDDHGQRHYRTEVVAEEMILLDDARAGSGREADFADADYDLFEE
jgi:single-strand DNA-binding protein